MAILNVSTFVSENSIPILQYVFFRKYDHVHPTERSYLLIMYKQNNALCHLLPTTSTEQATHPSQRPQMPSQEENNPQAISQQHKCSPRKRRRRFFQNLERCSLGHQHDFIERDTCFYLLLYCYLHERNRTRQHQHAQQSQSVEPVEGLLTQQQSVEQIEQG